jgi:Na+-driven multidrug efflux pump
MGKKDIDTAERTLGACFSLQIIISTVLTVVLLIWNRDLLLMFGASENTIEYAADYMSIYAIGTMFAQLMLGMNAFITAQGFTKISMIAVVVGAISNIILDPILISAPAWVCGARRWRPSSRKPFPVCGRWRFCAASGAFCGSRLKT